MTKEEIELQKKELQVLTDGLNKSVDDLTNLVDKKADADKLIKLQDEIKASIEKLADKEYAEKMQKQVDKLEDDIANITAQKDRETGIDGQFEKFWKSDNFKSFKANKGTSQTMQLKASTLTTSNSFTETNSKIIQAQRDPLIGIDPRRPVLLGQLFRPGVVGMSDYVDWIERTSETTGTKNTAEGAVFGQSDISWTSYKIPVEKISDYIVCSREKLEDTDWIQSEIMDVLQFNIPHKLDNDLFTGDGTSNAMYGVIGGGTYNNAKTFAKPTGVEVVTAANNVNVLAAAALQVELGNTSNTKATGFTVTAHIVNPVDWFNMLMYKEADSQSALKHNGLTQDNNGMLRIFGVPVLKTQRITAGSFLTGDFNQGKLYTRRAVEIKMWDQNSSDPIYDQVTFTATMRGCLVIKNVNTYAFVTGTFANGVTALLGG